MRKLITFLGYSKSFYFTNLFELQMPQVPVKVFLEPRGFGGNDGSHDASFIYQIQREGHYYVIWESLEPNKATYIFRFSDLAKCNKGIVDFAAFLKSEAYSGRDNLRENGYSSVNSNQISRVFHNPEEKNDVAWLNAIKTKIGS